MLSLPDLYDLRIRALKKTDTAGSVRRARLGRACSSRSGVLVRSPMCRCQSFPAALPASVAASGIRTLCPHYFRRCIGVSHTLSPLPSLHRGFAYFVLPSVAASGFRTLCPPFRRCIGVSHTLSPLPSLHRGFAHFVPPSVAASGFRILCPPLPSLHRSFTHFVPPSVAASGFRTLCPLLPSLHRGFAHFVPLLPSLHRGFAHFVPYCRRCIGVSHTLSPLPSLHTCNSAVHPTRNRSFIPSSCKTAGTSPSNHQRSHSASYHLHNCIY